MPEAVIGELALERGIVVVCVPCVEVWLRNEVPAMNAKQTQRKMLTSKEHLNVFAQLCLALQCHERFEKGAETRK